MSIPHRPAHLAAAIFLAGSGLCAGLAHAEPREPQSAAEAGNPALPKVVVTAQRRQEAAQDIGAAISVIGGDELKEKGVSTVNDLQHATPSLEIEPAFGSGQPQFRLRGIGFIDYTSNNSSSVGVSVDDVAFALPIQTQGLLFDIDRVEVLRGPQGTLYGRNTTGGTVNFISHRPTRDLEAGIDAEYGSWNAWSTEGFVSGSLADNLRGRLSFITDQGGAWQKNRETGQELGDKDKLALRGQLEWDISDTLDAHLTLQHAYDKSEGQGLRLFEDYNQAGRHIGADSKRRHTGWSLRPEFAAAAGVSGGAKPHVDNTNSSASLAFNWHLDGNLLLTSISAYNELRRRELGDWDATAYADSDEYFDDRVSSFTQELRLGSDEKQRLNWVSGLYYSQDRLNEKFNSDFGDRLGFMTRTSYVQKVKTVGAFGQLDYAFNDRLKGILGLRQEYEKRSLDDYFSGFIDGTQFDGSNVNPFPQHTSFSNNGTSGKLALEYQLSPASLLYASFSRGYKSGGYTAHNSGNVLALEAFEPESVNAFEVGFKSDLSDNLRLNGALFYYGYHDQQVLSTVWSPQSSSLVGTFVNAPRSRIVGGELELLWQPLHGLEIQQYLGYKKGKYTEDFFTPDSAKTVAAGTEVYDNNKGDELSFPKLSYGGSIAYTWPVAEFDLRAETNFSYRGQYKQLLLLGSDYNLDPYWLVNANLSLTPRNGNWSAGIWARNLLDKEYDLTRNFFLPGTSVAAAGEPRSVGLRVSYRY
ncbi:TonB-dependent receptor [Stutzerimonas kirkiae]|uniref:TonB-dependent receptor n=1 Tax=Stutzerimonas kirkiae TaxID=2211392 RepID=A0A4Q9QVN0_9GAMM|nr:TonB-dependent receptor [Stutzerimonas kirkiae]TBU87908.1 TonB-dependent receptor [Stutzerimonas kirkiae]TBV01193.1 TonB-dependent receptor [Stutzerimonas kirkiae]